VCCAIINNGMEGNYPTHCVYVDPLAKYRAEGNEPDAASMLVQRLVSLGFNPMVDARGQPFRSAVNAAHGFVLLQSGAFQLCEDYEGGDILCLQTYPKPVSPLSLQYVIAMVALPLYGVASKQEYDPSFTYTDLADLLVPAPPQQCLAYSDFQGNTIRMYDNQAFVVDPAPVENPLKRDAETVVVE
jgi:hypothetical protein